MIWAVPRSSRNNHVQRSSVRRLNVVAIVADFFEFVFQMYIISLRSAMLLYIVSDRCIVILYCMFLF